MGNWNLILSFFLPNSLIFIFKSFLSHFCTDQQTLETAMEAKQKTTCWRWNKQYPEHWCDPSSSTQRLCARYLWAGWGGLTSKTCSYPAWNLVSHTALFFPHESHTKAKDLWSKLQENRVKCASIQPMNQQRQWQLPFWNEQACSNCPFSPKLFKK